jgi:hypothetical protein
MYCVRSLLQEEDIIASGKGIGKDIIASGKGIGKEYTKYR